MKTMKLDRVTVKIGSHRMVDGSHRPCAPSMQQRIGAIPIDWYSPPIHFE